MDKHCYIFAAGDLFSCPEIHKDSYIIAADAGFSVAEKFGYKPHLLVGDFDSLYQIPDNTCTYQVPDEKDYTDTELAINIAIDKGYKSFTVLGALGGERFEHVLANLQLAAGVAKKGFRITLTDGKTIVKAIYNSEISFDNSYSGYISIFSFDGDALGVTIKGLKYELDNVRLSCLKTLGVSNEFTGKNSSISVKDGVLIIVYHGKDDNTAL